MLLAEIPGLALDRSIANIIVVDQAGRLGVKISWREHARVGIPVTLLTRGVALAAGRPGPHD